MISISSARILDFDIENRPLSYWCPDRPSAEVTAIAWSWNDSANICCCVLGEMPLEAMLIAFRFAYDQADIVTGHYIRKHDLPILNGARIELGLGPLPNKLTSDTKLDLTRMGDLPASQEALAAYLEISAPKVQMTQADWREANRLTPEGLKKTRTRVMADVRQHKEMRTELLKRGLLKAPKLWKP